MTAVFDNIEPYSVASGHTFSAYDIDRIKFAIGGPVTASLCQFVKELPMNWPYDVSVLRHSAV